MCQNPAPVIFQSQQECNKTLDFVAILAILAICAYVAFFSIGFGPINWVLTSEVFPLQLRV
jgi:hypothetical protein